MTELSTFITLSTAHLTRRTSHTLSDMGADRTNRPVSGDWTDKVVCCETAYGHWIRARIDDDEPAESQIAQLPNDLAACVRHARQFGCRWILFDRDCPNTPGLASHDW